MWEGGKPAWTTAVPSPAPAAGTPRFQPMKNPMGPHTDVNGRNGGGYWKRKRKIDHVGNISQTWAFVVIFFYHSYITSIFVFILLFGTVNVPEDGISGESFGSLGETNRRPVRRKRKMKRWRFLFKFLIFSAFQLFIVNFWKRR